MLTTPWSNVAKSRSTKSSLRGILKYFPKWLAKTILSSCVLSLLIVTIRQFLAFRLQKVGEGVVCDFRRWSQWIHGAKLRLEQALHHKCCWDALFATASLKSDSKGPFYLTPSRRLCKFLLTVWNTTGTSSAFFSRCVAWTSAPLPFLEPSFFWLSDDMVHSIGLSWTDASKR